jgi:uncharacterized protein YjeT (DUF2065 family)
VSFPIRSPKPAARPPAPEARLTPRQKRTIRILAGVLIAGGLAVLFLVQRLPVPLRIVVGLTDIVAGLVLFLLVRQKG